MPSIIVARSATWALCVGVLLAGRGGLLPADGFAPSVHRSIVVGGAGRPAAPRRPQSKWDGRRGQRSLPISPSSTALHDAYGSSSAGGQSSDGGVPYGEAAYDPLAAGAYFRRLPLESFGRLVRLASLSGGFVSAVALDKVLRRDDDDDTISLRSRQLLEVVTALGPTFIKVGQALSIRTDLLPAPYAAGLAELQDAVPPFSASRGRDIVEKELGIRIDDVFSEFSTEPVASASIGQVYRARLRGSGEEVAVKVQRPNVLRDVSLDLYLMREWLVPLYLKINNDVNTDLVGLVDAWGTGFVNELDYRREAEATTAFSAAMTERGLGSVTAPEVVNDLSSMRVLTTKWVDGERLEASGADDVPRLCGVALNAYLTMLLDTGTLHCDPHPGNLLRTPDGRLCILDFGMCLDVPKDLQLSLLEFIANLQAENYEAVPDDLVKLGFVPPDKIDDLRASGLTYGIAQMLRLAGEGGGPKGAMEALVAENKAKYKAEDGSDLPTEERQRRFREDWMKEMAKDAMAREHQRGGGGGGGGTTSTPASTSTTADLTAKIEQLQRQNSNVFAIPEYFVYMSRAFATLEGIGLSVDPKYAILGECFPYLARRLLSDDSPRARGALRTLLYGPGGGEGELNLSKLRDVVDGLESYATSTSSAESSLGSNPREGRDAAARQLADVVLSGEGNYVQDIVLREVAASLDAAVRDAVLSSTGIGGTLLRRALPASSSSSSSSSIRPPLVAPLLSPLTLPLDLARAALELQRTDEVDARRIENVRVLTDLASRASGVGSGGAGGNGGQADVAAGAADVRNLLRGAAERRSDLARIGLRFGGQVATTQAERLRRKREVGEDGEREHLSELAGLLAEGGADRLERVADALERVDRGLAVSSRERR